METNGNQGRANGKEVEKFKRYVLPFVINGNSMVNHWKNLNGILKHLLLMGVQWNMNRNVFVVLISIQL